MYKTLAITLPEELVKTLEKKRKETGLNRSEFFRKAMRSFLGTDAEYERKFDKKYGSIYNSLRKEYEKTSEEMMSIASETIPDE